MNQIINKAEELFEVEQGYLKLVKFKKNNDAKEIISFIFKALSLEEKLKLYIAEHDPSDLEIKTENIRNTVKMVRDGKGLKSIEAYETLKEYFNSNAASKNSSGIEDLNFFENNWDNLFEIFHSRFDINSYFQGKLEVGPLITSSSLPLELKSNFIELRESYAYGLYKACVALCRMIIEISFTDVLSKNKIYRDALELNKTAKDNSKFEFGLFENINIASSLNLISKDLADKSHNVRKLGNKVIHTSQVDSHSSVDTISIIKNTINIIETLYS